MEGAYIAQAAPGQTLQGVDLAVVSVVQGVQHQPACIPLDISHRLLLLEHSALIHQQPSRLHQAVSVGGGQQQGSILPLTEADNGRPVGQVLPAVLQVALQGLRQILHQGHNNLFVVFFRLGQSGQGDFVLPVGFRGQVCPQKQRRRQLAFAHGIGHRHGSPASGFIGGGQEGVGIPLNLVPGIHHIVAHGDEGAFLDAHPVGSRQIVDAALVVINAHIARNAEAVVADVQQVYRNGYIENLLLAVGIGHLAGIHRLVVHREGQAGRAVPNQLAQGELDPGIGILGAPVGPHPEIELIGIEDAAEKHILGVSKFLGVGRLRMLRLLEDWCSRILRIRIHHRVQKLLTGTLLNVLNLRRGRLLGICHGSQGQQAHQQHCRQAQGKHFLKPVHIPISFHFLCSPVRIISSSTASSTSSEAFSS